MSISHYIEYAKNKSIELLSTRKHGQYAIYCIALYKNKIVAKKHNLYNTTHPKMKKYLSYANMFEECGLHAEVATLISARGKKIDTLLVIRANRQHEYGCAKPCNACQLAIKEYQKSQKMKIRIIYSDNDPEFPIKFLELL